MKVFLLDNNEMLCQIFSQHMIKDGIEIEYATSYKDAMEKGLGEKYDALFVDIVLDNGKTGLDFAREYLSVYLDCRVFVITGHDEMKDENMGIKTEKVFFKPFSNEDYKDMIRALKLPDKNKQEEIMLCLIDLLEKDAQNHVDDRLKIKGYFEELKSDYMTKTLNKILAIVSAIIVLIGGIVAGIIKIIN